MSYRRFLNKNDYHSVITPEALSQLIRGDESRFIQAEESAEISIIEYLSENYEIEAEFAKGKFIADYDRRITYPVGVFVYHEGRICEVIRSMSGYKAPSLVEYWEEHVDINLDMATVQNYSQFNTYFAGDIVLYNDILYRCVTDNGYKFEDIRIPMVKAWEQMLATQWQPTSYNLWEVVSYNGEYYTLMSLTNFDNNITPYDSDCWEMIADYDPEHNEYNLEGHDYVVYDSSVFKPRLNPNSDTPIIGHNITQGDPRNYNLKRHMLRLAIYELTKTIAPNNVSQIRMRDYKDSMKWLYDASKLKLNPQIPRKLSTKDNQPITDWQLATFQTDYNPHDNPWMV
ncbi:MAG: hypothetical protein SNJ29_14905 [Rikenellaceae bacterium]